MYDTTHSTSITAQLITARMKVVQPISNRPTIFHLYFSTKYAIDSTTNRFILILL